MIFKTTEPRDDTMPATIPGRKNKTDQLLKEQAFEGILPGKREWGRGTSQVANTRPAG